MDTPLFEIRVPGKLFIAGEYAVLEPEGQCIVAAVDRYVYAKAQVSGRNHVDLPQLGHSAITWEELDGRLLFSENAPKLTFIQNAITICHQYISGAGLKSVPFTLSIHSELDDVSGKKYGLGSSAAVVVAVITSVLRCHENVGIKPTKELIYKLASIAHFVTQGNGSCADIAASTFGGWVHYRTFDAEWLLGHLQNEADIYSLVQEDWPGLQLNAVTAPKNLLLCVGWTGSEMSTSKMIVKIQQLQNNKPHLFDAFIQESSVAVSSMVQDFADGNVRAAMQSLTRNRLALMQLGNEANAEIETPKLKELIRIADRYGAGKTSGAGGGDCGIAFMDSMENAAAVKTEWKLAQIEPLDLSVSIDGACLIGKGKLTDD
ncbi:phosphomevalonate kinase [Sporosarcina oncorhynchi]|uniref:phosphomevalonate kinase n=1 Tax=Sporosarcina oncorhynchi TaxID=3056444 RepID=A0ABZ0L903_9BACL|nr:phosphomevalonate kinase [Sporosarcina sp. T2O-4]WOV89017.1 phosphomevalonate kinase [Sporosarcina sp. T2O-4]